MKYKRYRSGQIFFYFVPKLGDFSVAGRKPTFLPTLTVDILELSRPLVSDFFRNGRQVEALCIAPPNKGSLLFEFVY